MESGVTQEAIDGAVRAMLDLRRENTWFRDVYWHEVGERALRTVRDVAQHVAPPASVLDVGCFNGYLCDLFAELGYRATGVDAHEQYVSAAARERFGFARCNLNEERALEVFADGTFDAVVAGEVFEHVFFHPLGLLEEMRRVLRPGGVLVLTTPNPSTAMNAVRVLRGQQLLWGTEEFATLPKRTESGAQDTPGVHYREYTPRELTSLLDRAGLRVVEHAFMPIGTAPSTSPARYRVKRAVAASGLFRTRLFGSTQYVVARLP